MRLMLHEQKKQGCVVAGFTISHNIFLIVKFAGQLLAEYRGDEMQNTSPQVGTSCKISLRVRANSRGAFASLSIFLCHVKDAGST